MKVALTVIGVIIVLAMFGTMLGGINAAETDERTDVFAAVVTGLGETTADVILVADIFDNNILNVTSITSDNVLDAPLPDTYVEGTNTLTVRGLNANDTRGLTIVYEYDALDDQAVGTLFGLLPLLVVVAVIMILIGVGIMAVRHR